MPGNGCDGASNGLLDVLGNPPVILFLEVTDGNDPGTRANGELGLGGRPTYKRGSTVDSEENEGGFVASRGRFPHQRVSVWLLVQLCSAYLGVIANLVSKLRFCRFVEQCRH